jgi:hypothetical protein
MLTVYQHAYFPKAHGFFSCCSLRLEKLVIYFIENHCIPNTVDCTNLFIDYKTEEDLNNKIDLSHKFFYFSHNIIIDINCINIQNNILAYHLIPYKNIPFNKIMPFINKFFIPSTIILNEISFIINKYNLNNFDNIVTVYYRGTDKINETQLGSYNEYLNKCIELNNKNSELIFLIQTDEFEFENYILENLKNKKIIILKEISNERNFDHAKKLLAITIILSKCKHIICSSSNVSLWAILFRGNTYNIHQYLVKEFLSS